MLPAIFLLFFFLNFRIISKSILHNHSNSIRKLNYDRRKWANTFLFFFFSSCLFFLGVELCYFFFSFLFTPFFFFFLLLLFSVLDFSPFSFWGVLNLFFLFLVSFPCFLFSSSLFGVGLFSFFFLGGAEFVLLAFGLFYLFLIFWGLVFSLSLSFDRLNKPLRNRFLIVLSRFSDRLRGTMVTLS